MQINREYSRWLVTRDLSLIKPHLSWSLFLEKFMICMSLESIPDRTDPVYIRLTPAYHYFTELDKFVQQDYQEQEVKDLKSRIIVDINRFLDAKPAIDSTDVDKPVVNLGTVVTIIYKEFIQKISRQIWDMIECLHKANGGSPDNLVRDITMCSLRYASIIGVTTQPNIHTEYFRILYRLGYRYEVGSPFNFRFGFVEFEETGKIEESRFSSLFPDVDSIFGGLPPISAEDPFPGGLGSDLSSAKRGIMYHLTYINIYDSLIKKIATADWSGPVMFVTRLDIPDFQVGKDDEKWQHLVSPDFVYENNTTYGVTIEFTFYSKVNIYYKGPQIRFPTIKLEDENEQLRKEWHRLGFVNRIAELYNPEGDQKSSKRQYEYLNIVERFLMSMANISMAKFDPAAINPAHDQIFTLEDCKELYDTLKRELQEKDIPNPEAIEEQIRNIIAEYFKSTPPANAIRFGLVQNTLIITGPKPVGLRGSGIIFEPTGRAESGIATYVKMIPAIRYIAMIQKAVNSGSRGAIAAITICALRYACILPRGQHWNIPYKWYKELYLNYGVRVEAFSSPFNSQLMLVDYLYQKSEIRFCSLFPDTDAVFGSLGSMFEYNPFEKAHPSLEVNIAMNPPYVPALMQRMVNRIEELLRLGRVLIFAGIPNWFDAPYYKQLKDNPRVVFSKVLEKKEVFYESSESPNPIRISPSRLYTTFIITNNPRYIKANFTSSIEALRDLYS